MCRKTLKCTLLILIFVFLLFPGITGTAATIHSQQQAYQGVIDLSGWDWDKYGNITLDGQWEFYWEKLYTPDDFAVSESLQAPEYIDLPRAWNKLTIGGRELTGNGYATYRLNIHNADNRILGIKLPRIFTSYKLWANGKLIAEAGKIGTDRKESTPQYLPQVAYFMPRDNHIELVIQISNWRHRSGGILESIRMGDAAQITDIRNRSIAMDLFLFGSLFIIGLYHIALYLFRVKERTNLYFGIFALLISARTLLAGEIFLIYLFPDFNWEIAHKIQTTAYYMGVPLVILFMQSTYPTEVSKKLSKSILLIGGAFSTLVMLTPARIFNHINPLYQLFSLLVIGYLIYIVALTIYKKKENSRIIGLGLLIFILFSINDIIFLSTWLADAEHVFVRKLITRGNLSSYGLLIFVITQSMVLAKKFSKSFTTVDLLSTELKAININLEEKIRERTSDLELSRTELQKAYQSATKSEKALTDFTQNISHDLRTPITAVRGYVDVILDGIIREPDQQKKYMLRIKERIDQMSSMVQDLLDLSMLQNRQISFSFERMPIRQFISEISEKYNLDMTSSNVDFEVKHSFIKNTQAKSQGTERMMTPETISDLEISIDSEKVERVLANLFSNSIKYSIGQPNIRLEFELTDNIREQLIKVIDTGIGISPEDLPHIFDRSFRSIRNKSADRGSSNGLGLSIAKEIIAYHGGRIWAESEKGKGSCFFLTIPICNKNMNDNITNTEETSYGG